MLFLRGTLIASGNLGTYFISAEQQSDRLHSALITVGTGAQVYKFPWSVSHDAAKLDLRTSCWLDAARGERTSRILYRFSVHGNPNWSQ
jgi:hypothetical protein